MSTCDTAARVRGVSRCAKKQNRTHTHSTRFKSTTGLPVPVLNPIVHWVQDFKWHPEMWMLLLILFQEQSPLMHNHQPCKHHIDVQAVHECMSQLMAMTIWVQLCDNVIVCMDI